MIRYACPQQATVYIFDSYYQARERLGCEYCQVAGCTGPTGAIDEPEASRK